MAGVGKDPRRSSRPTPMLGGGGWGACPGSTVEIWSLKKEGMEGQEADELPPPWAVVCEGREREEPCLVGQPLNRCILINKRSNSSQ